MLVKVNHVEKAVKSVPEIGDCSIEVRSIREHGPWRVACCGWRQGSLEKALWEPERGCRQWPNYSWPYIHVIYLWLLNLEFYIIIGKNWLWNNYSFCYLYISSCQTAPQFLKFVYHTLPSVFSFLLIRNKGALYRPEPHSLVLTTEKNVIPSLHLRMPLLHETSVCFLRVNIKTLFKYIDRSNMIQNRKKGSHQCLINVIGWPL